MAKILVIENNAEVAGFIADGLGKAGHRVDIAGDGLQGLDMARAGDFDLLIVDVLMPGLDGLSLVRKLRREEDETMVMIVSQRGHTPQRIKGLEAGADDYLAKPFAFAELRVRVKKLLERRRKPPPAVIEVADLRIDRLERTVHRGDQLLTLQPKQFDLLWALAEGEGEVMTNRKLLERVWDYDFEPDGKSLHTQICRLRNTIDKHFEPKLVQTLRGQGYALYALE